MNKKEKIVFPKHQKMESIHCDSSRSSRSIRSGNSINANLIFVFALVSFEAAFFASAVPLALDNRTTSVQNTNGFNVFDDDTSKYVNSNRNASAILPELTIYDYDLDDVSSVPDIFPDPDEMFNAKKMPNANNAFGDSDDEVMTMKSENDESVVTTVTDMNRHQHHDDTAADETKNVDFTLTFHMNDDRQNDDLREHDIIDNIMYIYYGSSVALRKSLGGGIIIIVGTVFALAAQILAIIFTLRRNRKLRRVNYLATITLNLLLTLCASNLMFILGVQASKNIFKCEMIAVLLHYFHMSTAVWGLCHTFAIYDFVIHDNVPTIKYNNLFAYGGSGVFVLFSFAISSTSYEIHEYCWMSVQHGMIINFMIPTSLLIVATTVFGTLTLRTVVSKQRQVIVDSIENILEKCQHIDATMASANILAAENNLHVDFVPNMKCCEEMEKVCENDLKSVDFYDSKFDLGALSIADLSLQSSSDVQDFAEFKRAIKFSLFFQPAFTVCWFLGVVALENRQSCVMPIIFIVCYNLLNWYILYRFPNISPLILPPQPSSEVNAKVATKDINQMDSSYSISDEVNQTPSCTDTIPLLCSVTGTGGTATGNGTANNSSTSTIAIQSPTAVCVEDIIYKTSMSQWDASMENINLDCISTISN